MSLCFLIYTKQIVSIRNSFSIKLKLIYLRNSLSITFKLFYIHTIFTKLEFLPPSFVFAISKAISIITVIKIYIRPEPRVYPRAITFHHNCTLNGCGRCIHTEAPTDRWLVHKHRPTSNSYNHKSHNAALLFLHRVAYFAWYAMQNILFWIVLPSAIY